MLTRLKNLTRQPGQGLLTLFCAAAVLAACGGGGTGSGTSAETRSSIASGPITGFGSIIINGVRFDDSSASVSDDDGNARSNSELRLGMMAEVEGSGITSDDSGSHSKARAIRFGPEIVGPVDSVAADGKSLVVLGETVQVTPDTIVDDRLVGGLSGLTPKVSIVEVHGLLDVTSGSYTATRIEPKPNAPFFKLRGVVSNIDTKAHTLKIGSGADTISYDGITASVPAALDNGLLVRVRLQKTKDVAGNWVATNVNSGVRKMEDHDEAELEGTITDTTFPVDKKFSVNGIPVDATNAAFPNGTAGIVKGARVEVKGSAVNGVVIAIRVSIETEHDRELRGFELHGTISGFDSGTKTFSLRGVTVDFGGTIEFRKGDLSGLRDGRKIEVKGVRSSDGTKLVALRITFED